MTEVQLKREIMMGEIQVMRETCPIKQIELKTETQVRRQIELKWGIGFQEVITELA